MIDSRRWTRSFIGLSELYWIVGRRDHRYHRIRSAGFCLIGFLEYFPQVRARVHRRTFDVDNEGAASPGSPVDGVAAAEMIGMPVAGAGALRGHARLGRPIKIKYARHFPREASRRRWRRPMPQSTAQLSTVSSFLVRFLFSVAWKRAEF